MKTNGMAHQMLGLAGELAISIFFAPVCNRLHTRRQDLMGSKFYKGKADKEAHYEKDR